MRRPALLLLAAAALIAACDEDFNRMTNQPRYGTYAACEICPGGTVMQTPPPGTVARTQGLDPPELARAASPAGWVPAIPIQVDRATLERGRNRFDMLCAACHGRLGNGRSKVAENMSRRPPPSLVDPPARDYPPGQIFAAITDGYGFMPSYAYRLGVRDRWAVVAYVQALALSQGVELTALPADVRKEAAPWLR